MKILIPTAKELNKKAQEANEELLGEKTKSIIDEFADKKPEELAKIYKIKRRKSSGRVCTLAKFSKLQRKIL